MRNEGRLKQMLLVNLFKFLEDDAGIEEVHCCLTPKRNDRGCWFGREKNNSTSIKTRLRRKEGKKEEEEEGGRRRKSLISTLIDRRFSSFCFSLFFYSLSLVEKIIQQSSKLRWTVCIVTSSAKKKPRVTKESLEEFG